MDGGGDDKINNSNYVKFILSYEHFLWNLTCDMRNVNDRDKKIEEEIFILNI